MLLKCGCLLLLLAAPSLQLYASHSDSLDLSFQDSAVLDPAVVTGQVGTVKSTESIIRYRVLTTEIIKQMAAVNLSDLLSRQSNIRVSNDNMLGSSINLQNLSGQQIKFLVNGMPITGRENGNINLDQINLEDVERIEIIEGPMSVIYGTDALGGVINVITKRPLLQKTTASVYHYLESIGHINFGGSIAKPIGPKAVVLGGLSRNFFTGIESAPGDRTQVWKPREQVFGNFGYFRETPKAVWNLRSDYLKETLQSKGKTTVTPLEAYAFDDYFISTRGIHSLNTQFDLSPKIRADIINGVSHYKREKRVYRKDMVTLEDRLIENDEENTNNLFVNLMARAVFSNKRKSRVNYLAGYDLNYDIASADRVQGDRISMGDFAVFGMLDLFINKELRIRPGIRMTHNTLYNAPLTPSINMMWTPGKKWQIRAAYGNGFRAPSLKEQRLLFVDINHNIQGNPNLNAEFSHNLQAGVDFKNYHKAKGIAYSFGFNTYYNNVRDMIGLILVNSASNLYSYENYGTFQGGGFMLEQKTFINNLYLETGLGAMIVRNQFSEQVGKELYISPDITFSATYNFKKQGIKSALFVKHNGKFVNYIQNEMGEVSEFFTGAMTFADLTFSKGFYKEKIMFNTGIKNLFNIKNINNINPFNNFHSGGSGTMNLSPGRSFFMRVSLKIG